MKISTHTVSYIRLKRQPTDLGHVNTPVIHEAHHKVVVHENVVVVLSAAAADAADVLERLKSINQDNYQRKKRRYWDTYPYLRLMIEMGTFSVSEELNMYREIFKDFYRMRWETFDLLM